MRNALCRTEKAKQNQSGGVTTKIINMPEFIAPGEDDASVFPEEFTPEKIQERKEREYEELTKLYDLLDEEERNSKVL